MVTTDNHSTVWRLEASTSSKIENPHMNEVDPAYSDSQQQINPWTTRVWNCVDQCSYTGQLEKLTGPV